MELSPQVEMTKEEAIKLSNVLNVVAVFDGWSEADQPERPTKTQRALATLAVEQLREGTDSEVISLEFESDELNEVVQAAEIALDNPRLTMFRLITDLDLDWPTQYHERGEAFRSLATTADFVELTRQGRVTR